MMRQIFFIFMVILSSATFAAADEASTGPYNVSFELIGIGNHTVIEEPVHNESTFSVYRLMIITNNSSKAEIGIVEYGSLVDSSLSLTKNLETIKTAAVRGYGINMSLFDAKIDERDGFVITGFDRADRKLYYALYWLDSNDCDCGPVSVGSVSVGLMSSYPSEISEHLIDTLHVKRRMPRTPPALGDLF